MAESETSTNTSDLSDISKDSSDDAMSDTSKDSSDDEEQGPVRKRRRIDADNDSSTDLEDNELGYSDQTGTTNQERESSDPFPDLTKDQRVVLYTLLLCVDDHHDVVVGDDVTMGDIDVRRTLNELEEKGLVTRDGDSERFHIRRDTEIMKSYRENCLLSDIDKDFYIQVASNGSLKIYRDEYLWRGVPITLMRLVMEGRGQCVKHFIGEGFRDFVQEWCRVKNLDPIAWADGISYGEALRFVSAYTIQEDLMTGFAELVSDNKKWSILVSILMSKNYIISVNALWEERLGEIQGTFSSLRDSNHDMSTTEANDLIKDLVHGDKLLIMNGDGSSGTVGFASDDVRHQVMGYFVLDCLNTDEDYENYINLSSVDSLMEYVRISEYEYEDERCLHVPWGMEELFIRRLGIDAIQLIMVEYTRDLDADETIERIRVTVSRILGVPPSVFNIHHDTKRQLCNFVKTVIQDKDVSNTLIYNSLIGSFMIDEDSQVSKDPLDVNNISMTKLGILVALLMSAGYKLNLSKQWKSDVKETREAFPMLQDKDAKEDDLLVDELIEKDKVLEVDETNNVVFVSDDVRHTVMSFFVRSCLKTEWDYVRYLNLSSVDSLLEYVRTWWYNADEERCLHLPESMEELFIRRLGVDAIRHVMVDEKNDSEDKDRSTEMRETVSETLDADIPHSVFDEDHDTRVRLCGFLKTAVAEQDISNTCILNSLIGSFMIEHKSPIAKDPLLFNVSPKKWSIPVAIVMSPGYKLSLNIQWKSHLEEIRKAFPMLQGDSVDDHYRIGTLIKDKVLQSDVINNVMFVSDDVRHLVMSFFVRNCLKTDDDYKNYLNLSSVDSLLEYVRTWWYYPKKKERCMYLPERMQELFIRRLGIDVIKHVMLQEKIDSDCAYRYLKIRKTVSKMLKIPQGILAWDYAQRCRYADCFKKGTRTIHRARAMIVGCAGAGKSTLLKRLQKRSLDELQKVQSTVGLEVHEYIFEITPESNCLKDLPANTDKEGKQLLSVLDFGGRCAYYVCHQIYLNRRAFYLLVIDMSKAFDEEVDPLLCMQEGTMFTGWTYGEYLLFWLKSIHTYSENNAPVIIVGTHLDQAVEQNSNTLYNSILKHLQFDEHLKTHLHRERCFVLGFKSDGSSFQDTLSDLEKCIVDIAKQDRWKETIPRDWALSELVLKELKRQERKMIPLEILSEKYFSKDDERSTEIRDILKFYHEIGVILHFDESSLADTVIIDIQWFVDSFKNIITDPNHAIGIVDNNQGWCAFNENGHIQDRLLSNIWSSRRFTINSRDKLRLLQYMEGLGLISVGHDAYYIPCMNKRTIGIKQENDLQSIQSQTSVLVFRFPLLPYFFYFRLIVACLTKSNGEWELLKDNELCLFRNLACFVYKQHTVALAVNKHAIQLQVFQPSNGPIAKDATLEIRENIERLLNGVTGNFHKETRYTVGYQCSKQEVFREHNDCFVEEKDIHGKGEITCPLHRLANYHTLNEHNLLFYWKQDALTGITDE
ncbi:uncharacterized protein LOC125675587 isoform X2 [Ostrea edulis]|uniref:uncharacterized protein LOC125675587 isoform X2 n=1 Tax=Ostrea edulis TaxID=37623 RepID=UPI0024AFA534|nr:uncharacterized protein LOC125675587 isoform X2 [Ostrea edulis]